MPACGDETAVSPDMDLNRTVALALEANISAQISSERTRAADAVVKSRRTEFLPTFSTQYGYTRYDEARFLVDPTLGVIARGAIRMGDQRHPAPVYRICPDQSV